jgi:predicted transcriptional regulator
MAKALDSDLSRRERQIMDVVYAMSEATAQQVRGEMPDPPSNTSVRTIMRILEEKGHLRHTQRGREYVYRSTRRQKRVGQSAMRRVVRTFFSGSIEQAVAAHLTDPSTQLDRKQLDQLSKLIDEARKRDSK